MSPRMSVLMPVWETPTELLSKAIDSVRAQSLEDFELIIANDGSRSSEVPLVLGEYQRIDGRIKVLANDTNRGIVSASNLALGAATGEFVALLDHDDLLAPTALQRCLETLDSNPSCDLLYTDEAWVGLQGEQFGPFLKPDWSPERLRSQMYINHLSVYRRELVEQLGGFRPGFDGSQDYDLCLRVSEQARLILHLPEILYYWRIRPGQVSGSSDQAVYAAAMKAIQEHCDRSSIVGRVEQTDPLGIYRIHRELQAYPLVSIIIPTRGSTAVVFDTDRTLISDTLRSIKSKSSYTNVEFVVVADTETPEPVLAEIREICSDSLRMITYDRAFNYGHKMNLGVLASRGQYVVLLNDDMEIITPDWIEVLLGIAQQPDVGMTGCMLHFEDGSIQHGGHLYVDGHPTHVAYGAPADYKGPVSALTMDRECSGVTAACAMMRRLDYLSVGGLSRLYPVNFNDVDLCLKIRRSGKRIVWTPWAKLYHFESKTRDGLVSVREVEDIRRRWGRVLEGDDPYWRYAEPEPSVMPSSPAAISRDVERAASPN